MNSMFEQIVKIYRQISLSGKILIVGGMLVLIAGFSAMFYWANQVDYQPLYTNLSPEDASEIVDKLQLERVPYQLIANGTTVMVPAEKVYDLRLSMAGAGIPKGDSVGFEVFDQTDFGTTEFVQKLNYQRALQGELSRTIREFREVIDARVMIVMPRESVFVEDSKPPSASVLLKLDSRLSKDKVAAVVHLVAGAVEGLTPEQVTVVDTNGHVLSQATDDYKTSVSQTGSQLTYKQEYERNLAEQIQSMLESIVGSGKAIVRVTADMNYDRVDINEEFFDPDSQVVRSRQRVVESSDRKTGLPQSVSSVNPGGLELQGSQTEKTDTNQRQDETINYEINRTLRRTVKPVGDVTRLSVAVVLDGKYETVIDDNGGPVKKYVERTQSELDQFETVVKNAMGYNADREDQVTVASFPFSYIMDMETPASEGVDWSKYVKQYGKSVLNLLLVVLIFACVIRPLIKAIRSIQPAVMKSSVSVGGETEALPGTEERTALPMPEEMSERERAMYLAKQDMDKTAALLKGWVNEAK